MSVYNQLRKNIQEEIRSIATKNLGIAFSGGIDSSLLAKAFKDDDRDINLFTISFITNLDITISQNIAQLLKCKLFSDKVSLETLKTDLKLVMDKITFKRLVRLENCACFYYVFKLAAKHDVTTVVSANGADELFCGYNKYKRYFGREIDMHNLMVSLVKIAREDKAEIDKIAELFDITYLCPFLSRKFVDFALTIPFSYKIQNQVDGLRKHVLRQVALDLGVPPSAAFRPKKAFQYSSGIHKAIKKLVKQNSFTKALANQENFKSPIAAYLKSLQ